MSNQWRVKSIFHFVLNCQDIDKSIEFYTRFGFEVLKDNRDITWPDYVAENFAMAKAQGNAAQLGLPGRDDYQTRIDLVQWTDPVCRVSG